ncbi:hypothetical protein [Bacillus dakarensis]|uniref:hypothetical protein n=1 Tax=Robertmurraya dakarensis TaxID=1926278 RepID=UPI000980BF66|nr:hypothetical protein [Bacillus dakarensis]
MKESEVLFYDKESFEEIDWKKYDEGELLRNYFSPLVKGTRHFVANVITDIRFVALDHLLLPYTINQEEYENSYVCSPYNHYITYTKEELRMLQNPPLEKILGMVVSGIGIFSKKIEMNRVVYVNNWLISTNLFSQASKEQIRKIKEALVKKYPNHLIGFRSVNDGLYEEMKRHFVHLGFQLLPSRYVYISGPDLLEKATKKTRNTLGRDRKLLNQEDVEVIHHEDFSKEDLERAKDLYDMLYLEKYSYNNPQFSQDYIFHTHRSKSLTYVGIRYKGKLEGVFGSMIYQDKMANPVLGYNTALPIEIGLYRMLRYLAVNESIVHQRMYHQSAGVGRFKYDRGATGYPEYTAIFVEHLAFKKRFFWRTLSSLLNRFAVKIIEKKRL